MSSMFYPRRQSVDTGSVENRYTGILKVIMSLIVKSE